MRPRGTAAELEQRRRIAIALLKQGLKPVRVAKAVGTSGASVTRWRQAYEEGGDQALAAKPHPGRSRKLTEEQRQQLGQLLQEGARKHGYRTELWTLPRVAEVILIHFGVQYHPGHVWRVLRGMGWSCQKPEHRARERDEEAIRKWRQKDWPRIKKSP